MPRPSDRVRTLRSLAGCLAAGCLAWNLQGCRPPASDESQKHVRQELADVLYLDQGFDDATRELYYFTDQGSRMLPYDWFLHLEVAGSRDLFRSDAHVESLRYLPAEVSDKNPDGLPVGFAKTVDGDGRAWVGPTCALCHTGQIEYRGRRIRIDGGASLGDFKGLNRALVDALRATRTEPARFGRFAAALLGDAYSEAQAETLGEEIDRWTASLQERIDVNVAPIADGFGRMDAVGQSFNGAAALFLDLPENARPPDAPVSFPFLWGTSQSNLVEWNGFGNNHQPTGRIGRNFGEAMGIFNDVEVVRGARGYKSTVPFHNLGLLEEWVADLESPRWPEDVLGPIDAARAARGGELYAEHCLSCHELVDRQDRERRLTARMVPVDEIGTDPKMADNYARRRGKTGVLQGTPLFLVAGPVFGEEAALAQILLHVVVGGLAAHPLLTLEEILEGRTATPEVELFEERSYKARSLNGVWATAPYLHNGSVPNLWELLRKPEERTARFRVGSHGFDPVNVGYETGETPGDFEFDTSIEGNRNTGHDYGTGLPEDDRRALVEYLKSL